MAAPLAYKLGDKTYTISPLTLNDWAAYTRVVQFHDYMDIKDDPLIPDELKAITLQECVKKQIGIHGYEVMESYDTPWGLLEFAYLSLKKQHPEVSRETLADWRPAHVCNVGYLAVTISQLALDEESLPEEHKKKALETINSLKGKGILV